MNKVKITFIKDGESLEKEYGGFNDIPSIIKHAIQVNVWDEFHVKKIT